MPLQTFEQSISGGDVSMPVATDFTSKQYYAVDVDSSGNAVVPAAAGQAAIGFMQSATNGAAYPGAAASVRTIGISKAVAGAAINAGAKVAVMAGGKVKTAVPGASDPLTASHTIGRALTAALADGDLISVLIQQQGAVPTTAA